MSVKKAGKSFLKWVNGARRSYSRLIPVGEAMGWAIDRDIQELAHLWKGMGIRCLPSSFFNLCERQSVFLGSQFSILDQQFIRSSHRLAIAYFHGLPEQGHEELDSNFREFVKIKDRFTRIQVSHERMKHCLLDYGFQEHCIHCIPIAINPHYFRRWSSDNRLKSRQKYSVPSDAFVIGSFQKDGVGWGEGNEPKWIKGPDLFLRVMENLKDRIPNLFVLLSGPSRGYVCKGLEQMGVAHVHHFLERPEDISQMYECLDAYLVASRDEGGPKAILESMISEIPLVSSRVGQAVDLIEDGRNAFLVDVGDVDAMTDRLWQIYKNDADISDMIKTGYLTALQHTYEAQNDPWYRFMNGFVRTDKR